MIVILTKIWLFMAGSSIVYSFFSGRAEELMTAALETGGECISLMLTLLGTMGFFNGMIKIADSSGITAAFSKILAPFLKMLFPEIPKGHKSIERMSMNITANMLGLGNAATPLGISAMKALGEINPKRGSASRAMCFFTVINTASVQLIPTTVIAFRLNYGSENPYVIILPILISSMTGLIAGLLSAWLCEKRSIKNALR